MPFPERSYPQLLKSPDDHCCSLNYYAPDYLFLLVFSRKANAAVPRAKLWMRGDVLTCCPFQP